MEDGAWFKEKNTLGRNKFFGYQKERVVKCQQASWLEDDVKSLRPFYVKHLILIKVRTADPRVTLYSSLCVTKVVSANAKIKKWDQFPERLIPPRRSFLLPVSLAEFPSGAWVLAMSTYLSRLSSPREESKEGHLPIFKWCRWPNIDGANSLSWNFVGIPRKPSYSASFSLLIF